MYQKKEEQKPKSLEEIGGIKPQDTYIEESSKYKRYQNIIKDIILSIPLLVSGAWLTLLLMRKNTITLKDGAVLLAPPANLTPLIVGIIIFMIGYIIFMCVMFSDTLRGILKKAINKR